MSKADQPTQQKDKVIVLIGKDTSEAFVDFLKEKLGSDVMVVGDGIRVLTRGEVEEALSNTDENTHIHYCGHSGVENGIYEMDIVENAEKASDLLAIKADAPGVRHMWGCCAGAAKNDVLV